MSNELEMKKTRRRLKELEEAIISQRRLVALDLDDLATRARLAELLMELDSLLRSCGAMSRAA